MRVLVAPAPYKGSLSAAAVGAALARGLTLAGHSTAVLPVADGGEGTLDALGLPTETVVVPGPYGDPVQARLGQGEAGEWVVELAQAAGLHLTHRREALVAATVGVGRLVRAALDRGARRVVVTLGGSATTDGGAGLLIALGARVLDARGQTLACGGGPLNDAATLDLTGLDPRLRDVELVVATDVGAPLLGPRGAARRYGPQKGAVPDEVERLESGLRRWADLVEATIGRRLRHRAGAGAAGGCGFALMALGARRVDGARWVLRRLRFRERAAPFHIVVTGEGRVDEQTSAGKAPYAIARAAPGRTWIVAGQATVTHLAGAPVRTLAELAGSAEAAQRHPERWLELAGEHLGRDLGESPPPAAR